MIRSLTDRYYRKRARHWVTDAGLTENGIRNLIDRAKHYNSWRYAKRIREHKQAWENERQQLLVENGADEGFNCSASTSSLIARLFLDTGQSSILSRT